MPLKPVIDSYEALLVRCGFKTFYLDPADEGELRQALAPYLIIGSVTKYAYPLIEIKKVELKKTQLYGIESPRYDTPIEQVVEELTSTVENVMSAVRKYSYNVRMTYREAGKFSEKISELKKEQEDKKEEAKRKIKKYRESIISTPISEYQRTFTQGVELIDRNLFQNDYPNIVMEIALSIIHHKWGHLKEKEMEIINEEKEKFLLDVVAPLMMGEN